MQSFFNTCLWIMLGLLVQSQAASESAYSDQTFDPAANSSWYESPLLWLGFALLIGIVIIWQKQKR